MHRKFDPSGTGKVSKSRLIEALVSRGEKLSPSLVRKYINDPAFDGGGEDGCDQFEYVTFLQHTLKTSQALLSHVKAVTAENESNYAINSKTYTKVHKEHVQYITLYTRELPGVALVNISNG